MGSGKTQEPMAILVPSKGFVKVLGLNIAPNSSKITYQYEQIRQDLWKTVGCFLLKPFEKSVGWNIWDVTPIKSPLVTRLKVLTGKM
jgi:hypothetical protein